MNYIQYIHIKQLIADRQSGMIDEAGNAELDAWLAADAGNWQLYDQLDDPALLSEIYNEYLSVREEMSEKLGIAIPELREAGGSQKEAIVYKGQFLRKWRWVAACLILAFGIGGYFLFIADDLTVKKEMAMVEKKDIQPGKEGALLTLGDGTQLSLDTAQNGVVALQGGAKAIVKDGQLIYDQNGAEIIYNTITTQVGRQYKLTLPDGTQVWLNAASAIRYPTVFKGNDRRIDITGEVYLEVAKQPGKPFIVNADNKAKIEVLGTSFNINAYDNEEQAITTLIDGKVKVNVMDEQRNAVILKPGQQARISTTQANKTSTASPDIQINSKVNIGQVLAWKNGAFNFDGASFEEAMRQLERWYDINVVYKKKLVDFKFRGGMDRNVKFSEILEVFTEMGLAYDWDGKTITIK